MRDSAPLWIPLSLCGIPVLLHSVESSALSTFDPLKFACALQIIGTGDIRLSVVDLCLANEIMNVLITSVTAYAISWHESKEFSF